MDLFGLFGSMSSYYYTSEYDDVIDSDSFMKWLMADDYTREQMELTMSEEGKIAFKEREKKLGFFNK